MKARHCRITDTDIRSTLASYMRVTVQVVPEVARAILRGKPLKEASSEVSAVADRLAASIKPLHHEVDDETSASYLTLEVTDRATADQAVNQLLRCRDVRAAFVKPRATAP
jgi:hypothetical protein